MERRKTRTVFVGDVGVGSDFPISVQSMTNTKTENIEETTGQINRLAEAGCDIVRVAVPGTEAAENLREICLKSPIPVIADIHYDWRLAVASAKNGADCLRINPGNIGSDIKVGEVVKSADAYGIPIRIGVNAGSLEEDLYGMFRGNPAEALSESACRSVERVRKFGFEDIKVSLKSSSVVQTIDAYTLFAGKTDLPLHVGITEAGSYSNGVVKSSVGIGSILSRGIGDTIRVSFTGDPVREVEAGIQILEALGFRERTWEIVSCPTCGRCSFPVERMVEETTAYLKKRKVKIKIAIMGCIVNGPGEAKEADLGITGGSGKGILFRKGEILETVDENRILDRLFEEIDRMERKQG